MQASDLFPSVAFVNNLMYHEESCDNCMERCCIIVGGRRRDRIIREMT